MPLGGLHRRPQSGEPTPTISRSASTSAARRGRVPDVLVGRASTVRATPRPPSHGTARWVRKPRSRGSPSCPASTVRHGVLPESLPSQVLPTIYTGSRVGGKIGERPPRGRSPTHHSSACPDHPPQRSAIGYVRHDDLRPATRAGHRVPRDPAYPHSRRPGGTALRQDRTSTDGIVMIGDSVYWTTMDCLDARSRYPGEAGRDYSAANGGVHAIDQDGNNRRDLTGRGSVVTGNSSPSTASTGCIGVIVRASGSAVSARRHRPSRRGHQRARVRPDVRMRRVAVDASAGHLCWTQKGPSKGGRGRIFRPDCRYPTGIGQSPHRYRGALGGACRSRST